MPLRYLSLYIHSISVCQQSGISLFLIPFLLLYLFFMRHPFCSSALFIRRSYTFRSLKVPPSLTNLVRVWYATSYEFGIQLRTTLVNGSSPFAQRPLRFPPTFAAIFPDFLKVMRICSVAVFSFFVLAGMLSATGCQPWGRGGLACPPVLLSRFPFPPFFFRARYI